jgi:hypothetical protein
MMLAAVIVGQILFAGGDDVALAKYIEKQYHAPVAILADAQRRWPKAIYESKTDRREELRDLGVRLNSTDLKDGRFGMCKASWPVLFYMTQWRDQYKGFGRSPRARVEGGRVALTCDDADVSISEAFPADLGFTVSWHWFFEGARLVVRARNVSPADYVNLVAKAVGAKVVGRGKNFYLDFDPTEYRRRANEMFRDLMAKKLEIGPVCVADYNYSMKVLAAIGDADLSKYMSDPANSEVLKDPMSTELRQAAIERLMDLFPVNGQPKTEPYSESMWQAWERLQTEADFSKMYPVFFTRGFAGTMVEAKRGGKKFVF